MAANMMNTILSGKERMGLQLVIACHGDTFGQDYVEWRLLEVQFRTTSGSASSSSHLPD